MSVKDGFKEFGERAKAAMMKVVIELDQKAMLGKPVVTEIHPDNIPELRKKVLEAVNLIE